MFGWVFLHYIGGTVVGEISKFGGKERVAKTLDARASPKLSSDYIAL
jgi:hypothetical protein